MAAITLPDVLVLDRFADSFVNDKGQTIDYFQARLFDPATGDFYVVSTLAKESLAALEPGTHVQDIECDIVEPTNIRATKVKPVGAPGVGGARTRF